MPDLIITKKRKRLLLVSNVVALLYTIEKSLLNFSHRKVGGLLYLFIRGFKRQFKTSLTPFALAKSDNLQLSDRQDERGHKFYSTTGKGFIEYELVLIKHLIAEPIKTLYTPKQFSLQT